MNTITVHDRFDLSLTADPAEAVAGSPITLKTSANRAYQVNQWMPEVLFSDQHVYQQAIPADSNRAYMVIGESQEGCIDTAIVAVIIIPFVFIPSAFSPDANGLNDVFRPVITGGPIFNYSFNIYNRWGQRVFTAADPLKGWDGKVNGIPAELSTYMYHLQFSAGIRKKVYKAKGDVTLIR